MRFGEKLRKLRKDSHLTQAELAKRAGLGLKTITNYEKGTTYPQDRRVYGVLAEILGTSADYLHNENDDFVSMAGKEFGYRGRVGAEKLVGELSRSVRRRRDGRGGHGRAYARHSGGLCRRQAAQQEICAEKISAAALKRGESLAEKP